MMPVKVCVRSIERCPKAMIGPVRDFLQKINKQREREREREETIAEVFLLLCSSLYP